MYLKVPSLTCWYMSYFSNYACQGLEIHWRPHRLVITMPTNDGLVLQAVAWPHREFHAFRNDIERNYMETLKQMPEVAARLLSARRETLFFAMADVPSFFRKPFGNGWALVGDAGHHKDPVPAYGISDAFCDAELLAEAIDSGLSGKEPLDKSLADYERQRNQRAIPDHRETCQRATLEGWDAPEMLKLRQALRGNAADTGQFLGMIVKAVDPAQFLAPENMARILNLAVSGVPISQ
jgi:flavin-dependent dehydrogenase